MFSPDMLEPAELAEEVKPMSKSNADIINEARKILYENDVLETVLSASDYATISAALGIARITERMSTAPPLSESTKAKLRALRVLWPEHCWVVADFNGSVYIYIDRPRLEGTIYSSSGKYEHVSSLRDEITFDMGPVYYWDL